MAGFTLKSVELRRERRESWEELERLLERVQESGVDGLSPEELHRLPVLYRAALSSLSVARSISLDRRLVAYLEGLAARSYIVVYGVKRQFWDAFASFFTVSFPAMLYQRRGLLALAFVCLGLGTLIGFWLVLSDPDWYYSFVSSDLANGRSPLSSREELERVLTERQEDGLSVFAGFLFSHNTRVGLLCFFLGFALGAPVVVLLFTNGLMLGAFAAIHHQVGLSYLLWTWVLPHGVTELSAVCVCGAAGFATARAVIFPGKYGRVAELARAGRAGGQLVLGSIAMFFVAALLEGYFRQLVTDPTLRSVVVLASVAFWLWYVGIHGRRVAT